MRQLFELCGKDRGIRFSPYVWRVRLCLLHKGLAFEGVLTRFLEKEGFAASGSKTVPVLNDNGTWVADSFKIATYLDDTYPDKFLFDSRQTRAQAAFLNDWINRTLVRGIFPMVAKDIVDQQSPDCADYFRATREKFLGCTLEESQARRPELLPEFRESLAPLRAGVAQQEFLCGDAPGWFDYAVFGSFVWPHVISDIKLITEDDALTGWYNRMMDLFDGHIRGIKTVYR